MSEEEIMERVRRLLVELFEVSREVLTPDATLYDKLGLDSLDSVDLVVALQKEFGFEIVRSVDEEKISAMRELRDVCDFVHMKLRGEAG